MYENPFDQRFIIIAEKPSVALTIASALGYREKKDGYMEGPDGVVTWCFGHLAEYATPETYDEQYKRWSLDTLPVIPGRWQLVVPNDKKKQFQLICRLLRDAEKPAKPSGNTTVVNACDAGREGELIFRRVYELSGTKLPVKRLWISSMEDDAILDGFLNMKDGTEYRNLADASVCRAQADWLVGMNASRAFTSTYDYRLTVGRVQTPTLAMLVKRGEEIANFKKEPYFITHLLVDSMGHPIDAVSEHFRDREEANRLAGMCRGRQASVTNVERQTRTAAPPKLYDLTSLQRDANRLFGLSASRTLSCAQALYENKLITYPRTDSRYLTDDMEKTALDVVSACRRAFPFLMSDGKDGNPDRYGAESTGFSGAPGYREPDIKRLLDNRKVSDHHAIIPTVRVRNTDLSGRTEEEKKILTLIAARLLCACGERHVYDTMKASFLCCGYTFTATGRTVRERGWKAVEAAMMEHCRADAEAGKEGAGEGTDHDTSGQDLSTLYQGALFPDVQTKVTDHWTKPLPFYTEDTLLHAMETAGAAQMEEEVERKGLGTPATRASVIDRLAASGYIRRSKRNLIATESGKHLVDVLPEYLKSPQMTTDWENQLLMIERGRYSSRDFMDNITLMIRRIIEDCRAIDGEERKRFAGYSNHAAGKKSGEREEIGKCPVCGKPVYEGNKVFHCSDKNCSFVLWKKNRYLDRMRTSLNPSMAGNLLEKGRTHVKSLYSPGKDKYFAADLVMEWKDGRASYRLDFQKQAPEKDDHGKVS